MKLFHIDLIQFFKKTINCRFLLSSIALFINSGNLFAHGFGERYDLPVPLSLYLSGAASAVFLSFVIIAFFVKEKSLLNNYPRLNFINHLGISYRITYWFGQILKVLSVCILIVIIISGLYGVQSPFENIVPTFIWVIWWVGFSYIVALLGNIWAAINPWSSLFLWVEKLWILLIPTKKFGLHLAWPKKLERWPAVFFYCWFIWAELIWPQSDVPDHLAQIILNYSTICWIGMWLFGRHQWLQNAEMFSIFFSFIGRFSASEFCIKKHSVNHGNNKRASTLHCINDLACFENAPVEQRRLNIRPWAVGLLTNKPLTTSSAMFVLLMLASVTFDGLMATSLWAELGKSMIYSEFLRPMIIVLQNITGNAVAAVTTIAFFAFLLVFLLVYSFFSAMMWVVLPAEQRNRHTISKIARTFVLSLIPIALAYHLAHYLSYLAIVGQYIIPLSSDPMGLGWDLFGSKLYQIDISVTNAKVVWYTSVVAIVIGHIIAVWLAHLMAMRTFCHTRTALISQIPMLFLMISYTLLSLWIMAQPVVEM